LKGWLQEIWAYVFGYSWLIFCLRERELKEEGSVEGEGEKGRRRICYNGGERKNHRILLNGTTMNF
jgi:hypothetical protein